MLLKSWHGAKASQFIIVVPLSSSSIVMPNPHTSLLRLHNRQQHENLATDAERAMQTSESRT